MKQLGVAAVLLAALAWAPAAAADLADERALAEQHAPVVRLVEQTEECGPGEPYRPIDVDLLFDEPTVALRGPWNPVDLVEIGPSAGDLSELYEYHLDFPGDALNPGCTYERWGRRLREGSAPTVYAHVATERGQLALQYWLFYVYNDWNNLHEGDWEMIQFVFEASDAREALRTDPVSVGYSQHEGAERADWGDEKLELVEGNRPVVYPAAGSHANFFGEGLHVGSSGDQGVGCDDTRGPHVELEPNVVTIASDPSQARAAFPWITYEGRWGELQDAFFNGPTGPNLKRQWTEPITWSEGWRSRSYAVPTGGLFGTSATDFFCEAVATGSRGLITWLRDPVTTLIVLAVLTALVVLLVVRATWRPAAPLRLGRRRTWGQVLSAAGAMYVRRAPLFLGIGLLLIPLAVVISILQALVLGGFGLLGVDATGEEAGALVLLVVAIGLTLTLLGLGLVQAATACALVGLDSGEEVGPAQAYRLALARIRPLLGALGIAVAAWVLLTATAVLVPVAIWLVVRWSLLAQVVEVEGRSRVDALRRSAEVVSGRWLRVASLVVVGAALALAAGPLLGAVLIVLTDAPLPLLNLVAGVVYALAIPFVALTTSYTYFDARTREALAEPEPDELPAEIELA
jgi:Vacuolar protein sorting-associated protein 62